MNINYLTVRVTKREGGTIQVSNAQTKDVIKALRDQLLADTGGNFDLYLLLHALKEPDEHLP